MQLTPCLLTSSTGPHTKTINAQGDQEGNPKVGTVALPLELDNHNFVSGGVVVVVEERARTKAQQRGWGIHENFS